MPKKEWIILLQMLLRHIKGVESTIEKMLKLLKESEDDTSR
jgi:hypothetical protein